MSFRKRKIICRPVSRFVQVPSTEPHGFLIPEKESSKMPIEGECASPTGPSPSDPMKDTEGTEPSQKKAKSSQHVPGHGASSKSQHGHDVFQGYSSAGAYGLNSDPFGSDAPYQGLPLGSHFPSGSAMPSGPPPMFSSSAGPTPGAAYSFNPPPYGSNFPSGSAMPSGPPPMSSSSTGPTPGAAKGFNPPPCGSNFPSGSAIPSGPPPMSSGSAGPPPFATYQKAGYTVAISNGSLCYSGEDKGMVMMISGTPFAILIANGNSHGK